MAPDDERILEPEEEVLPGRLDPLEPPPVEPLGDPERGRARMARLHRQDLAFEHAQALGRAMDHVAFGHGYASYAMSSSSEPSGSRK